MYSARGKHDTKHPLLTPPYPAPHFTYHTPHLLSPASHQPTITLNLSPSSPKPTTPHHSSTIPLLPPQHNSSPRPRTRSAMVPRLAPFTISVSAIHQGLEPQAAGWLAGRPGRPGHPRNGAATPRHATPWRLFGAGAPRTDVC